MLKCYFKLNIVFFKGFIITYNNKKLTLTTIYKNNDKAKLFNFLVGFYESHFMSLVAGLGHGIIINSEGNLSPNVELNSSSKKNVTISFEKGTFIDKEGNLIVVPEKISQSFNIDEHKEVFFYIKGKRDSLQSEKQGTYLFEEDVFGYEIEVTKEPKNFVSEYIELCRISIDSDNDEVTHPLNPFNPQKNEIDIRFVSRVLNNNSLDPKVLNLIAQYLTAYANFFTQLSSRLESFSATIVASIAYQSVTKVATSNNFSPFEIYLLVEQLISTTNLFKDEMKEKIEDGTNHEFIYALERLTDIFSGKDTTRYNVKFYDIDLTEGGDRENFWENIFSHIKDISESEDEWKFIVEHKERVEVKKEYLLVGRVGGDNLDIEIDNDYISGNHLRITKNDIDSTLLDIEDIGSANGTFFQGIRYEKYRKVTIQRNEKIELYDYEFDLYNNPIVQEFLNIN